MPPTFDLFFFGFVLVWELFWLWKGIRDARADDVRYRRLQEELTTLKSEVRDILTELSDRLEIAIERSDEPERHDTLRAVGSQK